MRIGFNFPERKPVEINISQAGKSAKGRAAQWRFAHAAISAQGGRMNEFAEAVPGAVAQADGSHILDLLARPDLVSERKIAADGQVWAMDHAATEQQLCWGAADHYMLERAPLTGDVIVEPGRNHRKIYVSNAPTAYSAAMIAAAVGRASVNATWLKANPEWGGSEDKALIADLGLALFRELTKTGVAPNSTWLLFQRGYDYAGLDISPARCSMGEGPLHPIVIGAWGAGPRPKGFLLKSTSYHPSHYVYRDLEIHDAGCLSGWNWLFANVHNGSAGEMGANGASNSVDGWTQYRTITLDVHKAAPSNPLKWHHSVDRCGGGYWSNVNGLLFDECFWDHNGWQDGYSPDNDGTMPQPPSMMSHNVYIAHNCRDVTIDRCLSSRSSSIGLQMRPGGRITDCFLLDNNIICNDLGGNYDGAGPIGEYGLHLGNIGTSAGYRLAEGIGGYNWGMDLVGRQQAVVDCIVCHMSNPADPIEVERKKGRHFALNVSAARPMIYNNTIHYNWANSNSGVEALDLTALQATTIQTYAGKLFGRDQATIAEYLDHVRALPNIGQELDRLLEYFRSPYGRHKPTRTTPETCIFKPDYRGEGFRWDNRLNWSSGDLPGSVAGDTVDLHGNRVKFGRLTRQVAGITFRGALLEVTSGKLVAQAQNDRASVELRESGQYVAQNGDGAFAARGGRLTFTGKSQADLVISGQAECLFGADLTIPEGQTLRIDGGQCFAGWDGSGDAVLTLQGGLDLRATPILAFGASKFSPRYKQGYPLVGQGSGFTGVLDSIIWNNTSATTGWHVRVRDMRGTPVIGEKAVDKVAPGLRETWLPEVGAVMAAEMPKIAPFRSGIFGVEAPSVKPHVALSGPLHLDLTGLGAGSYPLIEASITGTFAKVTVDHLAADLDAEVVVSATGVRLILRAGTGKVIA